ncbi:class I SAM-dependent methyltransferase [bacterium]|nr:class I SAM-dependent methyltransferase [candidate division CSSED10-310 bacterium]
MKLKGWKNNKDSEEDKLLNEINAILPSNIDWKKGAKAYLRQLVEKKGEHNIRYHLIKPFLGGPDFNPFFIDFYNFLNIVQKLDLEMKSRVIDVGCGSGWLAYYLGKMGHTTLGIDISEELIELARKRVESDPYPPFIEFDWKVSFMVCDLEESTPRVDEPFDAAIFESVLHHFYNPIAVLRNVSSILKPEGVIAISEGHMPEKNTSNFKENLELMRTYGTIERPFTRKQLKQILSIAGFNHFQFYNPVNGLFTQNHRIAERVYRTIVTDNYFNIVLASRSETAFRKYVQQEKDYDMLESGIHIVTGCYERETSPEGKIYRWSGPECRLRTENVKRFDLVLSSHCPHYTHQPQCIRIFIDNSPYQTIDFDEEKSTLSLDIALNSSSCIIDIVSENCFSPKWYQQMDSRLLSFMIGCEHIKLFK